MSASYLLVGLGSTARSLLQRNLRFKLVASTESVSYVFGYGACGVAFAASGFGVWSLVAASLAQTTISSAMHLALQRHPMRPIWQWRRYAALLAFGSKSTAVSFLEFVGVSLDTIVIGRVFDASTLGIYNRASIVVNLPAHQFSRSLSKVLFPSFSSIQNDRPRLRRVYVSAMIVVSLVLFSVCFGIAAAAHSLVLTLLGNQWREAIPVVRWLAIAAPIGFLTHFYGVVFEATNYLWRKLAIQGTFVMLLGIGFSMAAGRDLVAFAIALTVAQAIRHIWYIIAVRPILDLRTKDVARIYLPSLLLGAAIACAIWGIGWILQGAQPAMLLGAQIAVGVLGLGTAVSAIPMYRNLITPRLPKRWRTLR